MKEKRKKVITVSFMAIMVMMAFLGVVSAVTIENHTMCKDTEDSLVTVGSNRGYVDSPVNETTEFYVTDSKAICFVQIERINRSDTFRFEWYDPSDLLYKVENSSTNPYFTFWFSIYGGDGKLLGWEPCWFSRSLMIDGYPPANKIGIWHVDFYYNEEKQFTETFTISETIPASGAPTSGRWIGTTSQGKDVAFIVGDTQVYNFAISYKFSCSPGYGYGRKTSTIFFLRYIVENKLGPVFTRAQYSFSEDS